MFDLGGTLVDSQGHAFDHAAVALDSIASMRVADGKKLLTCLVSDVTLATPPLTAAARSSRCSRSICRCSTPAACARTLSR
ncbi:MAG: hypothetical protein IIZ92_27555 [Aquincola sp.]|nr:hypothetical protein [Aquincola sp.]|tara:strand:+ start:7017 stop:7259 length:243 start_codon:yes stop_codon:yes gene_type:complete